MHKRELLRLHRGALEEALAGLRAGQSAARAGTRVDGTHRPASRGERAAVTSEGYLAHGLSQRIAAVQEHLRVLDQVSADPRSTVANGALVVVEGERGDVQRLFVVPGGSGTVHHGITFVSATSPWVAPFVGQEAGEVADVVVGGERREVELVDVS